MCVTSLEGKGTRRVAPAMRTLFRPLHARMTTSSHFLASLRNCALPASRALSLHALLSLLTSFENVQTVK